MSTKRPIRCAIYTRKSTEEGLEQDFNSLDAQREACEAYVVSQKAEGWLALKDQYDDGGYSGGTLERPALRRLLEDIEAGRVGVVVVYKIDRLSRSLMDFARLVEVFDRKSVTFVSVTQAFNTTTSMGRLTLNVLLSFAQFEREVTGERIRDKFAASKRKGIWMGGSPPLGYDVAGRKLVVNEAEAETVRLIFQRYLDLGCVRLLCADLQQRGLISKKRVSENGRSYGGRPLGRSAIYLILHNRTYIGETHHKGRYFKGEHKGIVLRPQFEAVQKRLEELAPASTFKARSSQDAPLTGLVFDEAGMAMLPTYTIKHGNQRYRYYTSRPAMIGKRARAAIHRIPAPPFEALLSRSLERFGLAASDPVTLAAFVRRIDVLSSSLRLRLDSEQMCAAWRAAKSAPTSMRARDFLADCRDRLLAGELLAEDGDDLILLLPVRAKFRGGGAALYAADGPVQPRPDAALLKAIARAWRWRQMIVSGEAKSIDDIATRHGQDRGHVGKILNLAFLSPAVIRSIVHGDQPAGLRLTHLLDARVPLDWGEQTVFLQRLSGGPAENARRF